MDEDEAVARMRAADPAASAEPDAERLAERTAARRGDELAERRERRTPGWVAVAAVTAGALAIGGAGYGIGRGTADNPDPQAETTVATGAPELLRDLPAEGAPEAMTEEDTSAGAATDMAIAPGYGGRTTFTAQGLSDEAGTAPAWALDGAATVSAETASRAAEALGVEGEPRQEGGWVVGPADGSGPGLQIGNDGAAMLYYYDTALDELVAEAAPMPLPGPVDESGDGVSGGAADSPAAVEPGADEPSAVEPSGQAPEGAAGVLYETLAALGLDPDAVEYEVQEHWSGGEIKSVTGHQLAGGQRTGLTWSADVLDGRVYTLGGPLAPLVELGEYDVVSPAEAVERLSDPRFGGSEVWRDDMLTIEPAPPERDWNAPPGPPPAPGSAIPWAVTDVTITSAELTLTDHWTEAGAALLLPAYELADAEGRTWRVLAVADHELAFQGAP